MFNEESVFGCGVIDLKDHQPEEFRKLHETTIAKKLRLGSNFPREALNSRKNAVGLGLIKPKKVAATLAWKLYIGNVRANMKTCKIIRMQEESLTTEHERNWKGKGKITHNPSIWSEEVFTILSKIEFEIRKKWSKEHENNSKHGVDGRSSKICKNERIKKIVDHINYVRLHKKVYLSEELLGVTGRSITDSFDKKNSKRQFKWKSKFQKVEQPGPKLIKSWDHF